MTLLRNPCLNVGIFLSHFNLCKPVPSWQNSVSEKSNVADKKEILHVQQTFIYSNSAIETLAKGCKTCSKTIKITWRCFDIFIANFEHISYFL